MSIREEAKKQRKINAKKIMEGVANLFDGFLVRTDAPDWWAGCHRLHRYTISWLALCSFQVNLYWSVDAFQMFKCGLSSCISLNS